MPEDQRSPLIVYLFGGIILLLLLVVAGVALTQASDIGPAATRTAPEEPESHTQLAEIRYETARLVGTPRQFPLTTEQALAARAAVLAGDFPKARGIAAESLARSQMQPWRFWPFTDFIETAILADDDGFRDRLNAWAAAAHNDPLPLLFRAQYHFATALHRRAVVASGKPAAAPGGTAEDSLAKAAADVDDAIRLDGSNPYGFLLRLRILAEQGNAARIDAAFQSGITKFPTFYPLYRTRLATLTPKAGGSVAALHAFADKYADAAAPDSPLRMLHLALYAALLDAAAQGCAKDTRPWLTLPQCVVWGVRRSTTPKLEEQVLSALNLSGKTDKYHYSVELGRYLSEIAEVRGGRRVALALLRLAADSTGTDTGLERPPSAQGNYMVDLVAGDIWLSDHADQSAERKYLDALHDLDGLRFPDDEGRGLVLGDLYDRLVGIADRQGRYIRAIAYTDAAIALSGDRPGAKRFVECHAYYQLGLYAAGANACAVLLTRGDSIGARFWHAKNCAALGNIDMALAEFKAIADSDARWGVGAALESARIQRDRNNPKAALAVLDAYPYLFSETDRTREDLARAYDDRCAAHLGLGEIDQAIADCADSLRFGSLPDALANQQQLARLLKDKVATATAQNGPP